MAKLPQGDLGDTLADIIRRKGMSVAEQLVDIQAHAIDEPNVKKFVSKLRCFKFESFDPDKHPIPPANKRISKNSAQSDEPKGVFRLKIIDASDIDKRDYIALSYTWDPCKSGDVTEEAAEGGYLFEDPFDEDNSRVGRSKRRRKGQLQSSSVRDCVLTRALKYLQHKPVKLLWIDAHSVDQVNEKEKQNGIQAMHLVYSYSKYPLALLARPIRTEEDLELLFEIMKGYILRKENMNASSESDSESSVHVVVSQRKAWKALQLLKTMTDDLWWTRSWTFQENYRALKNMTLLMPCLHEVSLQPKHREVFGAIDGELCIKASDLLTQATEMCKAYSRHSPLSEDKRSMIAHILSTMGKYTVRLSADEPMYPTIISDVTRRGITAPWDRLDILANTCWYPIRLDSLALQKDKLSLSLSILAQCLLNGELMIDGNAEGDSIRISNFFDCTLVELVQQLSFRQYCNPRRTGRLTYNRGCRYPEVTFRPEGIETRGHLWKMGPLLDYRVIQSQAAKSDFGGKWLSPSERNDLIGLIRLLVHKHSYHAEPIISQLKKLLDLERSKYIKEMTFTQEHPLRMATELINRAREGSKLRLAEIWDPRTPRTRSKRPLYRALFFDDNRSPGETTERRSLGETQAYVFTALDPVPVQSEDNRVDDNRHVYLEVDIAGSAFVLGEQTMTPLSIKKCTLGFCNFRKCDRTSVLFRWPPEFKEVA
ncbi:Heterokaryon incompatibility [Fusarium albosuccineum]|uniref:Heterokaryon incompatibility n=1 Tax=Fusarium albosuccineum TaxID=1237068 RepID=A0A8H4LJT7_9HYPO|nr:Heterokaryon incompatibility [Fusarium albosuccineum]